MSKTVLSYSGTGVQGGPMAQAFAAAGYTTRTITRDPSKEGAQALVAAGVELRQGDLGDPASLAAANEGVDIVALLIPFFVPPPNSPMDYLRNAISAAEAAGAELLVWNPSGSIPEQRLGRATVDFRHDMLDMLRASSVPSITVAPGAYMENLMGPWTATAIRADDTLTYPLPEGERIGWISINDVAQLMVAAAGRPDKAGEIIRVNGPQFLTGPEMAQAFSNALERPIAWERLTPQQFGEQVGAVMGPEMGAMLAEDYAFINQHMKQIMSYRDMTLVLDDLDVSLTPLEAWVQQHAAAFAPQ